MATFDVAHIREQGVDLIVVPLDHQFDWKSPEEKNGVRDALQRCASAAGLIGTVVPIWQDAGGTWKFLAPREFSAYFQSVDYDLFLLNLNRELTCEGY